MRSFWEQTGVLGTIYRLLGRGLNNDAIAARLNITQEKVEGCIAWLLHFLTLKNRKDLVLYASKGKWSFICSEPSYDDAASLVV